MTESSVGKVEGTRLKERERERGEKEKQEREEEDEEEEEKEDEVKECSRGEPGLTI